MIFAPPLRVTALVPRAYPLDGAGFWSFVDERGRVAVAFAMSSDEATEWACELLPGARAIHCTRIRREIGTPLY